MSSRPAGTRHVAAGFLAASVLAAGLLAPSRLAGARDGATPPPPGLVGAAVCAPCHEAAHGAWAGSWHARSTRRVRLGDLPPSAREGRPVRHGAGETTFREVGARTLAATHGAAGALLDVPLAYAVGGRRVTMLVGQVGPEGPVGARLQVLPSMRDEVEGAWFDYADLLFGAPGLDHAKAPEIAPGDASFWTGPVRSFEARCARCHVGAAVDARADADRAVAEGALLGPDCEACHGPGAAHTAYWRAVPTPSAPDPILRLPALGPDRLQDACLLCHLEGEIVAPTWAAGEPILEHVDPTLLDDADRLDAAGRPLELVYEGVQLLASRCASRGGLRCVSCHEVHGAPRPALLRAPATGAALCAECHARQAGAPKAHTHHEPTGSGAPCVACHMPPVVVERGHGHVTDHTISTPFPVAAGAVAGRVLDACTACHTGARGTPTGVPRLASERLVEAFEAWYPSAKPRPTWSVTLALGRNAAQAGALEALDALLGTPAEVPEVARASAARLLGRHGARALPSLRGALGDPSSLVRRNAAAALGSVEGAPANALLLRALGDPSAAVRVRAARAALEGFDRVRGDRALLEACLPVLAFDAETWPLDDPRWFRLGAARELAGDLRGALEAYRRQVALDPFASTIVRYLRDLERRAAGR